MLAAESLIDPQYGGGSSGGSTGGGGGTPGGRPPSNYPSNVGSGPLAGHGGGSAPAETPGQTGTDTVAQAYLAALASMGKNTTGDASPYVLMNPGAGTSSGGGIGLGTVLVLGALGLGVWWFVSRRRSAS